MACSCMMRAPGLPDGGESLVKERTPWGCTPKSLQRSAALGHCVGGATGQQITNQHNPLRPSRTWDPRAGARLQRSCQSAVCTGCRKGGGDGGDSQLSKSRAQRTTPLRKASSSIWEESLHFLDAYITRFVSYFGDITDFCVIFLKPFALQICFQSNNLTLLEWNICLTEHTRRKCLFLIFHCKMSILPIRECNLLKNLWISRPFAPLVRISLNILSSGTMTTQMMF